MIPMLSELSDLLLLDFSQMFYHRFFKLNYTNRARWFLLHSLINFVVVYYSLLDLYTCFSNSLICYKIPWNYNSTKVYYYASVLHIYHCLFFKLTPDDILHHVLMVALCGTLCYYIQSIISSFALFFLSGLPGAIDYMLLYLVKMDKIHTLTEKKVYTYISAYLRAPGCVLTLCIGMNGVIDYYNSSEYINLFILLLTISLIFWNGQYYLLQSHESYIKKKYSKIYFSC